MSRPLYKFLLWAFLAAICFAAAFVFFPSKAFFEEKVKEALRGLGF